MAQITLAIVAKDKRAMFDSLSVKASSLFVSPARQGSVYVLGLFVCVFVLSSRSVICIVYVLV